MNGEQDPTSLTTWRYDVGNGSEANVAALIGDPAVEDVGNVDRETHRVASPAVRFQWREAALERVPDVRRFHQSAWLIAAGLALLWGSRASTARQRAVLACGTLMIVCIAALTLQLDPRGIRMGEIYDRLSPDGFESYYAGRIRFEKHLTQVPLLELYQFYGASESAPRRAMATLARVGAVWFVVSAAMVGLVERWSPAALRYLALTMLAPATLLFFGWLEFAYLSMSAAAFPLLARGLRGNTQRLEAGSAFAGIGAAFHGVGLVALAGAGMAALAAPGRLVDRLQRAARVGVWGTAFHLAWVTPFIMALGLSVEPASQPEQRAPSMWRPLFVSEVREHRVSAALLSATGTRDVILEAVIVGVPLAAVAVFLARRHPEYARAAFWYLVPSLAFLLLRWPYTGVGPGMDLVVAGFPAFFALAWICAQEARATTAAAAMLAVAHAAFWWAVHDQRFAVGRID